ncbi:MAG: hypothetical protein R3D98_11960 [Candidatus Krumholzibacteriia bacterium]
MRTFAIVALAALLTAGTAAATDRSGEFALGFNNTDAPVGLRYFFGEKVGADLGLGLESTDLGADSATSFFLEAGVTYVLYDYNSSYFFVRPAIAYSSLDDRIYGTGSADARWTVIDVKLNLGAEVRLADRFGLTFQHGVRFTSTKLPDEVVPTGGDDSFTDISTFGENVTQAGVWFTF